MSDAAARIRSLDRAATDAEWELIFDRSDGWTWDFKQRVSGVPDWRTLRIVDADSRLLVRIAADREQVLKAEDMELIVALRNAAGEIADLIQAASHFLAVEYPVGTSHPADAHADALHEALAAVEAKITEASS